MNGIAHASALIACLMDNQAETAALEGPLALYRARLTAGTLTTDPAQALVAERLQSLWIRLRGYTPDTKRDDRSFWDRLRKRPPADDIPQHYPHGLYLVGEVGRGKSMLMDLFFDTAEVAQKRRVHFHRVHAGSPPPHPRLAARTPPAWPTRTATTPFHPWPTRSRQKPGCSASTSSRSPISPTR